MDGSRSMQVPVLLFPQGMKIVCSGPGSYKIFPVMQSCWAHILRDAKGTAQDVTSQELCGRLCMVY